MRTPCSNGWPLPVPPGPPVPRLLSSVAPFAAADAPAAGVPKAELPLEPRGEPRPPPNPPDAPKPPDEEDDVPLLLLLFRERRSLAEADSPEPGAIWPPGLGGVLPLAAVG